MKTDQTLGTSTRYLNAMRFLSGKRIPATRVFIVHPSGLFVFFPRIYLSDIYICFVFVLKNTLEIFPKKCYKKDAHFLTAVIVGYIIKMLKIIEASNYSALKLTR